MDEQNAFVSIATRREEFDLSSDVDGLFAAALSDRTAKEDDIAIFHLLAFVHYHFLFSLTSHMRCHLSEAFASCRAAIDAALIAAHLITNRASQVAYAKREPPFDNFARYLGRLRKDKKPMAHHLMEGLLVMHGKISRFAVHADIGSFYQRVREEEHGDAKLMSFNYYQVSGNKHERRIHTMTLLHAFVQMLDVFSAFLIKEQAAVPAAWGHDVIKLGGHLEKRVDEERRALESA